MPWSRMFFESLFDRPAAAWSQVPITGALWSVFAGWTQDSSKIMLG
jgi:hypothetical protein